MSMKDKEEARDRHRQRGVDFLAMTIEERAESLSKNRGTKCHTFMNFIPASFMSSIDMNDPEEVGWWNRIFHYQRHPQHRPQRDDQDENVMYNQRVRMKDGRVKYKRIIVDIDGEDDPVVGKMLLYNRPPVWCRLVDINSGLWEVIELKTSGRRRGYGRR